MTIRNIKSILVLAGLLAAAGSAHPSGLRFSMVASGTANTCALDIEGRAYCWGFGSFGTNGSGDDANRRVPTPVRAGERRFVRIALLGYQACAIDTAQQVWCWGGNNSGAVGGGPAWVLEPREVVGAGPAVEIAVGWEHACALTATGGVRCWGWNRDGQLGVAGIAASATPVAVSGLPGALRAVTVGPQRTCAITTGGALYCWGQITQPQGTAWIGAVPQLIDGLDHDVATTAGGFGFDCVLRGAGSVACWGLNYQGQLGVGDVLPHAGLSTPAGLATDVVTLVAGIEHACAARSDGEIRCWGSSRHGQAGVASGDPVLLPRALPGFAGPQSQLSAGRLHGCAVSAAGELTCWGANNMWQLGNRSVVGSRLHPVRARLLGAGNRALSVGSTTCAANADGWRCIGDNQFGELGIGHADAVDMPVTALWPPGRIERVASGIQKSCAILGGGALWCWGAGPLGDGSYLTSRIPIRILAPGVAFASVAAGHAHACALDRGGGAWCWGNNVYGELGIGTQVQTPQPAAVVGLGSGARIVGVGSFHSCALLEGGAIRCWGSSGLGQTGNGTRESQSIPADIVGLRTPASAMAVGQNHACAIGAGNILQCWGNNYAGAAGGLPSADHLVATDVVAPAATWVALAAGAIHSCALAADGRVACWGDYDGDSYYGGGASGSTAGEVRFIAGIDDAQAIASGADHTCALRRDGTVWCWGSNWFGELADGTFGFSALPLEVEDLLFNDSFDASP